MQNPTSIARGFVMLAVFAGGAGFELIHRSCLNDLANGDFWWHLRTGLGILSSHTLPHKGWFSQSSTQPWIATSWLYEIAIALGYRLFDLRLLPLAAVACRIALAAIVFLLAGGLRGYFWRAILTSALAQYVLGNLQPLPVNCSVFSYGAELILFLEYRRHRDERILYALPPLFLLWANLHEQFVWGVLLLVLFTVVSSTQMSNATAGRKPVFVAFALSLIATCITPYGWRPYVAFLSDMTSAANAHFADRLALHFRSPQDYVLLLLTMAAFLVLGMRRSRDPLMIGLLVFCSAAGFHAQREQWMVVLAASAIFGEQVRGVSAAVEILPGFTQVGTVAMAALLIAGGIVVLHPVFRRPSLMNEIARAYPVGAADFIRDRRLPQPIFNPFPWGGFLAWYLPEYPVAIDGRTELYGADFNIAYAKVMNAEEHYSKFAPLNQAGTIVLEKRSLIAAGLAGVAGFSTVYSDDVGVVLVRDYHR
jgi:hypothetical protein